MAKRHWLYGGNMACPTKQTSNALLYSITAERFVARFDRDPDLFCSLCAKAARLALAKESAPKPPACKGERTDSDRYTELRVLVDAWQSHQAGSSTALADWRHK